MKTHISVLVFYKVDINIISPNVTCSPPYIAEKLLNSQKSLINSIKLHSMFYSNALTFIKGLPSIQVPRESYTVNYGKSITLECTVVSKPEHTSVNWTKLIDGNDISINFINGKYGGSTVDVPSLTIYNVEESDAGSYVCTATNENGVGNSTQINLVVNGGRIYYSNCY